MFPCLRTKITDPPIQFSGATNFFGPKKLNLPATSLKPAFLQMGKTYQRQHSAREICTPLILVAYVK
jgi:hypothetical protein